MKSKTVKDIFHNLSGVVFSLVVPLLLIPVYVNGMGLVNYGNYIAIISITYFISIASDIGMDMYIGKEVSIQRTNKEKQSKLYVSYLVIKAVALMFFIPFLFFLIQYTFETEYTLYFCMYCIFLSYKPTCIFNGLEWFKKLNLIEVLCKIPMMFIALNIDYGTSGIYKLVLLQLFYQLFQTLIMHFYVMNTLELKLPSINMVKNDLTQAFGYYISRLFVSGYSQASPYLASFFINSQGVAVYSIALQLFKVGLAILSSVNNVIYIKVVHDKQYQLIIKALILMLLLLILFLPIVINYGLFILSFIFKDNVTEIHGASVLLYIGLMFSSISTLCGYPILVAAGKDKLAHVTVIISSSFYYFILIFMYFQNSFEVTFTVLILVVTFTELISALIRVLFSFRELKLGLKNCQFL